MNEPLTQGPATQRQTADALHTESLEQAPLSGTLEHTLDVRLTAVRPGKPYPLGATWDGVGVNFAIAAKDASDVELCLFECVGQQRSDGLYSHARADRRHLALVRA